MAKNQENQWIYVVNEVEYTQAVVAEICEWVASHLFYFLTKFINN
jgi:hypothetical protein